jgi:hypothetical protein
MVPNCERMKGGYGCAAHENARHKDTDNLHGEHP